MKSNVTAARPIAGYLGGKRNLAKRLCAMIEATPHREYIEPFVGMGGVFLRRPTPARVEVINDLSGDVANLFRVVRQHYEPFVDELRWLIASRAEFQRQLAIDPTTLTDIDRAVRFLYLQRLAFGGRVIGRAFGVRRTQDSRINLAHLRAELKALRERLEPVTIEQLDYSEILRRYDGDQALFYLDPPYDEAEGYGLDFGHERYEAMAEQLDGLRGQFIMSINDTPFIRATFARFVVEEIDTTWSFAAKSGHSLRRTELIIRSLPR